MTVTHAILGGGQRGTVYGTWVTCPHARTCPYSAVDLYLERPLGAPDGWPATVVASTPGALPDGVAHGPYGRCVCACDNDAVDHQVVACTFANGCTGSLTVTAFTPKAERQTRIFGAHGQLEGDGATVRVFDFATRTWTERDAARPGEMDAGAGHGGGDAGLMDAWTTAVATGDATRMGSVGATLSSHLAVFAAEQARHDGRVVCVNQVTSG